MSVEHCAICGETQEAPRCLLQILQGAEQVRGARNPSICRRTVRQ